MISEKNAARLTGIFFIVCTGAAVVSGVFLLPLLEASDYLTQISANSTQAMMGALFYFVMAATGACIAIPMYPILKKHDESLALGAIGFRFIEGAIFMVGVFFMILLVPLSQGYVNAGSPADSHYQTIGELLLAGYTIDHAVVPAVFAFSIGALMYYYVFYQTKLVPRWISIWGILGILLGIANGVLDIFGGVPVETVSMLLDLPIFVNEMVLALWLIVKGFDTTSLGE